ncbi:MAG: hypothetical protein ACJAZP_003327 [Psychromonas sp.]
MRKAGFTPIYTKEVYSKRLKPKIRVVMLDWNKQKTGRALLYSTDIMWDAMTLINTKRTKKLITLSG